MPFKSKRPILKVQEGSMHSINTADAENLFGLWSVFSKCSETMEHGKRLEYMSWRLWGREVFCCAPDRSHPPARWHALRSHSQSASKVPALSSSVESEASECDERASTSCLCPSESPIRPELRRSDADESHNRGREKHITPVDLEKIVVSIREKRELTALSPLPPSLSPQVDRDAQEPARPKSSRREDTTPRPSSPPSAPRFVPESSTSTVATVPGSETSTMSPAVASDVSTSTDLSSHNVVRGFALGRVSSSFRSKTNLAAPQPILKSSQGPQKCDPSKKKGATFVLGGSSDEGGESSLETHMYMAHKASPLARSSLTEGLRKPANATRKKASFRLGSSGLTMGPSEDDEVSGTDAVIDSEEEDDDDGEPSESAIEDDDDEWLSEEEEDEEDEEGSPPSDAGMYQRVDSRPNLTSRRSLITTQLHERDRAKALRSEAARAQSAAAARRSRNTTPNGPSIAGSPEEGAPTLDARGVNIPSRPLIMTTSNTHPPALSPRTTRRNMLGAELTESLRKNLLWERQQKNATSNAALKRRHTSNDVKNLKNYPGEGQAPALAPINEAGGRNEHSWNAYFDHGLQEYHQKGW